MKRHELRPLVMSAVFFKDASSFDETAWAFHSIQVDRNLTPLEFHATSLDDATREKVYVVIHQALVSERAKVWALRIDPLLLKKTKRDETDLYIDYASYLLSKVALPDPSPEIYSDMKFYGAYPTAVSKLLASNPELKTSLKSFNKILATYQPMEEKKEEKTSKILKRIENSLEKKHDKVLSDMKKMINIGENIDIIKKYEFAELWIDWNEREKVREKYRESIMNNLKTSRQSLGIDVQTSNIRLFFVGKNENNAGVQLADFACNIIYKNFPTRRFPEGGLEGRIYEKCFIEEEVRL